MQNKLTLSLAGAAFTALLVVPFSTFAHETHMYEINGVEYEMVIGSLNEPVVVDDKTGVSLEIVRAGEFFVGAQDMLQVEMIAGDKSRIDSFSPVHGAEGQYKTSFLATVPTTLEYRIFGELEGVPFDQTFACNPVGHPASVEDTTRIDVSENVVQTLRRGNFGCPQPKEALGFPEPAASDVSLVSLLAAKEQSAAQSEVQGVKDTQNGKFFVVYITLGVAVVALGIAVLAAVRARKVQSPMNNLPG